MAIDFSLNEDQLQWQEKARQFSIEQLRPLAEKYDQNQIELESIAELANKHGLRHWWIPKEYGGLGATSRLTGCLIGEEIAWGCLGLLETVSGPSLPGYFLQYLGNESQKKTYLGKLASRQNNYTAAFALTEESSGSDIRNISCQAVPVEGGFILTGNKKFITNGAIADLIIVATRLKTKEGSVLKFLLVDKEKNNNFKRRRISTSGVRASHVAELGFDNFFVPEADILGAGVRGPYDDDSLAYYATMEVARIGVGSAAIGISRAALEYTWDYASKRKLYEKSLIDHQSIGFQLVDCHAELSAARLLVWRAAWMVDQKKSLSESEGSIAKLYSAQIAQNIISRCTEVVSTRAFCTGNMMEKWARDVRACILWEGTPNILRINALGLLKK